MPLTARRMQRAAMTLMELLIVVAILALMAMLAVPKLVDVYERSRSGAQAYSMTEAARMIETYYGVNRKYPEGWDTLTDKDNAGSLASGILNPNLTPYLTTVTLSDAQLKCLSNAGISHVFAHDITKTGSTYNYAPSDSGRERHHLGTGTGHDGTTNVNKLAAVDTTAGGVGENMLLYHFNVIQNTDAAADATNLAKNIYVVLGLGPRSTTVGTANSGVMEQAPLFDAADPSKYYARALAVFAIPATPAATDKAKLIGVFGPDGRSAPASINQYNNVTAPH